MLQPNRKPPLIALFTTFSQHLQLGAGICRRSKSIMTQADQHQGAATLNVAVIIVTFRSATLAVACLRSMLVELRQSRLRIRAFVVDNASGDFDTVASAIKQNEWSSWASCVLAPRNGGFAYGNNFGIQQALAEGAVDYFYLLNPDTELRSGAISSLVNFMEINPAVGIAGGSFENRDGSDWPISFRFPSLLSELVAGLDIGPVSRFFASSAVARTMTKTAQPTDWVCGAAMMIRPNVLRNLGGFDENYFLYFEETDFCRRARSRGFSTWYVPASRVMHVAGQSTKVTDSSLGYQRLPAYWFESRRRYFVVTFGVRKAMLVDLVAIVGLSIGLLKRSLLGKPSIPCFISDLATHTILRKSNRTTAVTTPPA